MIDQIEAQIALIDKSIRDIEFQMAALYQAGWVFQDDKYNYPVASWKMGKYLTVYSGKRSLYIGSDEIKQCDILRGLNRCAQYRRLLIMRNNLQAQQADISVKVFTLEKSIQAALVSIGRGNLPLDRM